MNPQTLPNSIEKSPRVVAARIPARLVLAVLFGLALALCTAITQAHATESYFDLPGDSWGVPLAQDGMRIIVNVPARRLALVEGEALVRSYPVAVGKPATPTPRGRFQILEKTVNPTWAPKGRAPVPPGPANPLGARWMRISSDGYGIHSTNDPASIGGVRSHGCIRMDPADAEDLFGRVRVGTPVEIVYELEGWDDAGEPAQFPDVYGIAAEAD